MLGLQSGRTALVVAAALAVAGSSALAQDSAAGADQDIFVLAGKLRKVRIVYDEQGNHLGSCNLKMSKEARVIDQMMCSLLASCIADGWSGMQRATKCINARVNELELQAQQGGTAPEVTASASPDLWLASGYESNRRDHDDLAPINGTAIRPGNWTFTELAVRRTNRTSTSPQLSRWNVCITPALGDRAIARLLAPPSFTEQQRLALPDDCRRWNVAEREGALSGAMSCRVPSGATSTGKLEGRVTPTRLVTKREQRWHRAGGWAETATNTTATFAGTCRR